MFRTTFGWRLGLIGEFIQFFKATSKRSLRRPSFWGWRWRKYEGKTEGLTFGTNYFQNPPGPQAYTTSVVNVYYLNFKAERWSLIFSLFNSSSLLRHTRQSYGPALKTSSRRNSARWVWHPERDKFPLTSKIVPTYVLWRYLNKNSGGVRCELEVTQPVGFRVNTVVLVLASASIRWHSTSRVQS